MHVCVGNNVTFIARISWVYRKRGPHIEKYKILQSTEETQTLTLLTVLLSYLGSNLTVCVYSMCVLESEHHLTPTHARPGGLAMDHFRQ